MENKKKFILIKLLAFFIAFTFLILGILTFFLLSSNLPQKYAKNYINNYINNEMGINLTFQSLKGNIYSNIKIDNIICYESFEKNTKIISLKSAEINYNILKIIFKKNTLLEAVDTLVLNNLTYFINRDKNGKWIIIKPKKNNKTEKSPKEKKINLHTKIFIQDSTIYYKDNKGWSKSQQTIPFETNITKFNGSIIFKGNNIGIIQSSGIIKDTPQKTPFTGKVNLSNNDFEFYSENINLDLNTWAPYAIPLKNFHTFTGNTLFDFHLTNAKFNTSKKNPIWYYLKFKLKNINFYTPYLKQKLTNTKGELHISKGYITKDYLNSLKHPFSNKNKNIILKTLKENNIITDKFVLNRSTDIQRKKITLFKRNYLNKKLSTHLNTPSTMIKFKNISTTIENIHTALNGHINVKDSWINLTVSPTPFNSNKIQKFFPETKSLTLQNNIKLKLNIRGNNKSPQLIGSAKSPNLKCLFLELTNVESTFKLDKNLFKFNITKASYLDGRLTNETIISNLNTVPRITTNTFISKLNSQKLFSNTIATGNIDAICKLTGNNNSLTGNIQILGKNTKILNQKLDSVNSNINIENNETNLTRNKIYLNQSSTPITTTINIKNDTIYITSIIDKLKITDPFKPTYSLDSHLSLNTAFEFSQKNKTKTLLDFVLQTKGKLNASIITPKINNQKFELAHFAINTNNDLLTISSCNIKNKEELLQISGTYSNKNNSNINLNIKNMSLNRAKTFTILPPEFLKLETGYISTKLNYKNTKNEPNRIKGQSELKNFSFYNNTIDTLSLLFNTSQNSIFFKEIIAKFNTNFIKANGEYNTKTKKLNIKIFDKSYIFANTINTPILTKSPIKGKINIDKTSITYEQNKLKFNSKLQSNKLTIENKVITNFDLGLSYNNNKYKINPLKGTLDNGSFYVKGVIEKELTDNTLTYFVSPKFSKLNINKIQSIWNSITKSIHKSIPKKETILTTFKIESPFSNKKNITIISSEKNNKSEIDFINLLLKNAQTNLIRTNSYLNIFQGTLNGKLDIIGKTSELPLINGKINIANLSLPNIQSQKNTLIFKSSKDKTNLTLHSQKGLINQSTIESLTFKGSFTKDLTLNIYSNSITSKKNKIKNFIVGNLKLPLKKSIPIHPIKLNLNLSKSNMAILEYINPLLKETKFSGNLDLAITGSLESPIFDSTKNSGNPINLIHQNTKFNIPTNKIEISKNTIQLNNLNIAKESTKDYYSFPFFNSIISGNIKLKQINFINPEFLITKVNLESPFTKTKLKTDTFKSDIEFKNTSITGNIIIGLNEKSINKLYNEQNLSYPIFKSDIQLSNTTIAIPESSNYEIYPLNLNLNLDIEKNVFFNSPIFGNNILGINADIKFQETTQPLTITGSTNDIAINNQITIENGSVTLLNKIFNIIPPSKQHIFSSGTSQTVLQNKIGIQTEFNTENQPIITPKLSFKALCTIENPQISTENTLITFTHIIMSINDTINSLNEINFEVFESNIETPSTISDLTFIKQFNIANQTNTNTIATDQSNINELLALLLPELYAKTISDELLASLGESQINSLVRQSILRPIEKTVAKQVGLNDIRINYNLGSKIIDNTEDTLGIQLIKNIISDRLILKLLTNTSFEKDEDTSSDSNFELSEIELSYYLLKDKNLSLNYNNYKSTNLNNKYLSKISMRYDYEF